MSPMGDAYAIVGKPGSRKAKDRGVFSFGSFGRIPSLVCALRASFVRPILFLTKWSIYSKDKFIGNEFEHAKHGPKGKIHGCIL